MKSPHPSPSRSFLATALVAVVALLPAAVSCTSPSPWGGHWNADSLGPRLSKSFLGYRDDLAWASYREFQWQEKRDINMTLRRHFLNNNPDNPFQPDDPSLTQVRGPHSLLPDPLYYFHIESLAWGLVFLSATGVFLPIPVGSLIATFEPGGFAEFGRGFTETFSGHFRPRLEDPPSDDDFRVKNTQAQLPR